MADPIAPSPVAVTPATPATPAKPSAIEAAMARVSDASTKVQALRVEARTLHLACAEKSAVLFDAEQEHRRAMLAFSVLARA